MLKFSLFISTNSGLAPEYKIELLVAKNDIGVVISVSFLFQPSAINKCKAAVPLDTATQFFAPNFFEISFKFFYFITLINKIAKKTFL